MRFQIFTALTQLIPFITIAASMDELLETVINLVPSVNPVNVLRESSAGLELPNVRHRIKTFIHQLMPFITIVV
jgi:hypothetical protein